MAHGPLVIVTYNCHNNSIVQATGVLLHLNYQNFTLKP